MLQKVNDLEELTVSESVRSVAAYYPDPRVRMKSSRWWG